MRRVLFAGGVLVLGTILTVLASYLYLEHRFEPSRPRQTPHLGLLPPPPRLQARPDADLAALRTEKQAQLEGWGWTDETRRYAHIPIERAMALYARQHEAGRLTARSAAAGPRPKAAQ